jgi:aconitate hydratase
MGVLPLQFNDGESASALSLHGDETFTINGVTELNAGKTPKSVEVIARSPQGNETKFTARLRIDTPGEADYYRHGGIMQYVLRSLLG